MTRNSSIFYFLTCFLFLAIISSCEKKGTKDDLSQTEIDSIKLAFEEIQISIDTTWDNMVEDDNQKIADAKRLLEEISYTNIYSPVQFDSLKLNLTELQKMRYDNISMENSELIDSYDSASNKIMNDIITLASNHPDYQRYPLMKELIKDIQEANGRVLKHRINYDFAAKSYNQFIEENKEQLRKTDSTEEIQKKPLFELAS
jgi:hypothetical protein